MPPATLLQMLRELAGASSDPENCENIRQQLETLGPREVISLAYGPMGREHRTGPFWEWLFRTCPTRWRFLQWVYSNQPHHLSVAYKDRSWESIATHSSTLAAMVNRIYREVRPRYPWMRRRTLYGYAFGQQRGAGKYERKVIHPPGGKRRVLYVPHRPLARVQSAVLRLLLNPAQESLPECVMGGRLTKEGQHRPFGIFQNAAAHVGQEFVASFDIKDFFPSVRLVDVVKALRSLKCPALSETNRTPLPWSDDAAAFVARLVTRRGRLPQGAPSSPAIANLVFREYDDDICQRLGAAFVYTRYFDDLTISISAQGAHANHFLKAADFQAHVGKVVEDVLASSPFHLNRRKTRCGDCQTGVLVTGLRVDAHRVSVRRALRRTTRAILHGVESSTGGFVSTASRYYDNVDFRKTRFDPSRRSHRDGRRRLSAERMAIMAVMSLCGDMKIEVPKAVSLINGRRIPRDVEIHEGKQAYRSASRLLSWLWQLQLRADSDDGHIVFRNAHDDVVARLRCDRNDGFFLLEKKAAFACLELWHRLHGLWSGMNPLSPERVFENIRGFRDRIRRTLDHIHIPRDQRQPGPVTQPEDDKILTLSTTPVGEIERNAGPLWNLLTAFGNGGDLLPAGIAAAAMEFRRPASNVDELKEWLRLCARAVHATCEYLPAGDGSGANVWDTLFVLDGRFAGTRNAFYDVEKKIVDKAVHRIGAAGARYTGAWSSIPPNAAGWIQAFIVADLRNSLQRSLKTREDQGRDHWQSTVKRNTLRLPIETRIDTAFRRVIQAVGDARWKSTRAPVFRETAPRTLSELLAPVFRPPPEELPGETLKAVWIFAEKLAGTVFELLAGDATTISQEGRDLVIRCLRPASSEVEANYSMKLRLEHELRTEVGKCCNVLDIVQLMRNWGAHEENDTGKHDEWLRLIKYVSKALGRHCGLTRESLKARGDHGFSRPQDLPLTPFESVEVMLTICDGVADALEELAPPSPT